MSVITPVAVTGCSPGAVQMAVPSPAPEVAETCEALVRALPDRVLDGERRKTEPASPLTAAYGDPPIELTCGVAPAADMVQSQCFEVNGVGWFAKEVGNGVVFTTLGRKVFLEVAVPARHKPEANALTDISDAVQAHNPVITPCL